MSIAQDRPGGSEATPDLLGPEAGTSQRTDAISSLPVAAGSAQPPPWFRLVVWDSLLGGCCPLLPVPLVDDMALSRVRRRMVTRLVSRWNLALAPHQVAWLAGPTSRWTVSRAASKVLIYPVKRLFRKVLYFLAIKEGVDTFSHVFHQGYLLHAALLRGVLTGPGGQPPDDARVQAVAGAIHATLASADTGPLQQIVFGVFRNSRRLVVGTLGWLTRLLTNRRGDLAAVEAAGADAAALHAGSPEAEQLVDRLLLVLWGEVAYRQRLERALDQRLAALAGAGASIPPAAAVVPPAPASRPSGG
jgi:hypothetical protein